MMGDLVSNWHFGSFRGQRTGVRRELPTHLAKASTALKNEHPCLESHHGDPASQNPSRYEPTQDLGFSYPILRDVALQVYLYSKPNFLFKYFVSPLNF